MVVECIPCAADRIAAGELQIFEEGTQSVRHGTLHRIHPSIRASRYIFNNHIAEVIHDVGIASESTNHPISPRAAVERGGAIPDAYEGIIESIPPQHNGVSVGI